MWTLNISVASHWMNSYVAIPEEDGKKEQRMKNVKKNSKTTKNKTLYTIIYSILILTVIYGV